MSKRNLKISDSPDLQSSAPLQIDKQSKKKMKRPKFTRETLLKIRRELYLRTKYQFRDPGFDEWRSAFVLRSVDELSSELFKRYELNENDPLDWRALFEAIAREAVTYHGKSRTRKIVLDLAVDLYEVCPNFLDGWENSTVAMHLLKTPPYSEKYSKLSHDALRKRIEKITRLVGTKRS